MKLSNIAAILIGVAGLCVSLHAAPAEAGAKVSAGIVRAKVGGIDVIASRTGVKDVVTLCGALNAGDVASPAGNQMLATLTGEMLDKGTLRSDKFAITRQLESVGAEMSFSVDDMELGFTAKCLAKDLPLVIALLAEQLRSPAFSEEELGKLKTQMAAHIRRQLESTDIRARQALSAQLFPAGHPSRGISTEEQLAGLGKVKVEDMKAFHAAHYGPEGMVLVAVGDVDPVALQKEVARAFEGWKGGSALPAVAKAPATGASEQVVDMPGKTSVTVLLGQATGLRHKDPDTLALRVGTAILGSGFTGRLMSTVRDKEGLTYGIGAAVSGDTFVDGQWQISATFSPASVEKGIQSTRRELQLWYDKGVTADELERRKSNLAGAFKVGLSTTGGLAANILIAVQRGYEIDWLDRYPSVVQALTVEQVNASIRKHLDPSKMVVVKAGAVQAPAAK